LGRSDHVISRLQESHFIVLRSKPISFKNSMAIAWSLNRLKKNNLFGPPSALTIRRPYENLGTFCILRMRSSSCVTTSKICATIVIPQFKKRTNATTLLLSRSSCNCSNGNRMYVALWVLLLALWVFHVTRGDMGERNAENLKQGLQRHSCR